MAWTDTERLGEFRCGGAVRKPSSIRRMPRATVVAAPILAGDAGAVSGRQRRQGRNPARSAAAAIRRRSRSPSGTAEPGRRDDSRCASSEPRKRTARRMSGSRRAEPGRRCRGRDEAAGPAAHGLRSSAQASRGDLFPIAGFGLGRTIRSDGGQRQDGPSGKGPARPSSDLRRNMIFLWNEAPV